MSDEPIPWRLSPHVVETGKRVNEALIEGIRELGARWAAAEAAARAAPPVDADLESPSVPSTKEPTE
jgi:hypothetical protein